MIRRLQKTGNSLSLTIPPAVLELLSITQQTDLHITTDGRQLFIKPVQEVSEDERFKQALDRTLRNHRETIRKLAK